MATVGQTHTLTRRERWCMYLSLSEWACNKHTMHQSPFSGAHNATLALLYALSVCIVCICWLGFIIIVMSLSLLGGGRTEEATATMFPLDDIILSANWYKWAWLHSRVEVIVRRCNLSPALLIFISGAIYAFCLCANLKLISIALAQIYCTLVWLLIITHMMRDKNYLQISWQCK